jgi:hypothetical protein
MAQLTGVAPPVCASVAEYDAPVVPFGKLIVVITGLDLMTIRRPAVSVVLFESVTMAVNENVPGTVGVPAIVP